MSEQAKKPVVVVEVNEGRVEVHEYGEVEVLLFDWDVLKDDAEMDDLVDAFRRALSIPDAVPRNEVIAGLARRVPGEGWLRSP